MGETVICDWLLSKLDMIMCPLKAAIFSRILSCNPNPVPTDTIIITIPIAIAATAIFIIGEDMLLLRSLALISLEAI